MNIIHRILSAVLVITCFMPQQSRADTVPSRRISEQRRTRKDDELDTIECPPGDRTDWTFRPDRPRAKTVEWIRLSDQAFAAQCEVWRSPGVDIAACAYVYKDAATGENYGVVYSRGEREWLSEGLQIHEMCHLKGWMHGAHTPQFTPAPFLRYR